MKKVLLASVAAIAIAVYVDSDAVKTIIGCTGLVTLFFSAIFD